MPLRSIHPHFLRTIAVANQGTVANFSANNSTAVVSGLDLSSMCPPPNAVQIGGTWKVAAATKAVRAAFLGLGGILSITGCHSAYIDATVSNHTPTALSVVQVEYPSASFGTQTIAAGADFHYRFKILGSGQMKITYTDSAEHEQKSTGPTLTEGTEGPLTVTIAPDGPHWQAPPPPH